MLAKEILNAISAQMNKSEMLAEIERAVADLEFMDAYQVADQLDVSYHTIRAHASRQSIGTKIRAGGKRIYFPSDVETLRGLTRPRGHNPRTLAMVKKMVKAREGGATLLAIGKEFDVTESYVSQLMRKARAAKNRRAGHIG